MANSAEEVSTNFDPYGKSIRRSAIGVAGLGAVYGAVMLMMEFPEIESFDQAKALVCAPFTFAAAGWFLGFSVAFLFAPTSYLQSDDGKKWLDRVGTESTLVARLACGVFALFSTFFFGFLVWATVTDNF